MYASGSETTVGLVDTNILDTSASPDGLAGRGIEAVSGAALTATGCTLQRNTEVGVVARSAGTRVDLVDTNVLDTNPTPGGDGGQGMSVSDGAALTATGCALRGNTDVAVFAAGSGTAVDLVDTTVSGTRPTLAGEHGRGLNAQEGAELTATSCVIDSNSEVGVYARDVGTSVTLVDTQILDTMSRPDGQGGQGIAVGNGAALSATSCTLRGNSEAGVYAFNAGTVIDLVGTRILETRRGRDTAFALGLTAQDSALVRATDCEVSGTEGPAIYVVDGGKVEIDRALVTGNRFAAALLLDGALTITTSTLSDTLPDEELGGSLGIYASDHFGAPTLTLLDSTIGPQDYAAVWLDGPGTFDIERSSLSGSSGVASGSATLHGNALFAEDGVTAWDGAQGLLLADNTFRDATGIGVLLHGSSAALTGNAWSGNGFDLRQQSCTSGVQLTDAEPDWAETWDVCPQGNVLIAYDIEFSTLYLTEVESVE